MLDIFRLDVCYPQLGAGSCLPLGHPVFETDMYLCGVSANCCIVLIQLSLILRFRYHYHAIPAVGHSSWTRRFRKRDVTGPGKKYRGRVGLRMEPRLEGRRDRKGKEDRSIQWL